MESQPVPNIERTHGRQDQTEYEPLYRVLVHNDDLTPMDFVVSALTRFFHLAPRDALQVMLTAHHHGRALVAVLPRSTASERVNRAHFAAGLEGYPLHFSMERE